MDSVPSDAVPSGRVGLSRRTLMRAVGLTAAVGAGAELVAAAPAGAAVAAVRPDLGVAAYPFELGQVQLGAGRFRDSMNRTLAYLRFIDVNRLLVNFRRNHGLSTQGAEACGGWEAPTWEFRSHSQGHFLSAWAQAYAVLGDTVCRDKAATMVAELAKCQAAAAGFNAGYLAGFPEAVFDTVERGTRNGVPYYCLHKTMAGLLDVWRLTGDLQARDVLLRLAGWVDWRTGRLSYATMQLTMKIEFGGMNAVLTDLYQQSGDARWLTVAQRFDHAAVIDPLAAGRDALSGLHANTTIPKIVGCAREFKATGTARYRDIAVNFWQIVTSNHSYAFGGNSVNEHFRAPGVIAAALTDDTCESCNTYNMLKLSRELFFLDPSRVDYLDYYEKALLNQLIGQQDPASPHGHVCYFTPTRPGGRRGRLPGRTDVPSTYSTDYSTFSCCQGTGLETHTKLADSIYFYAGSTLFVNLFVSSTLSWTARNITVVQETAFPAADTSVLRVTGSGNWTMKVRIPAWTSGAQLSVNGVVQNVAAAPGTFATLSRTWATGDTVTVRLPASVAVRPTPDNPSVAALTYGPVVLAGTFGDTVLDGVPPRLDLATIRRPGSALTFTANTGSAAVTLIPFYDAHHTNYSVYFSTGPGADPVYHRLVNQGSGLVLGIQASSTADGGLAQQEQDAGAGDQAWQLIVDGGYVRLQARHSGRVLGIDQMSVADGARAMQWADNGTADHQWELLDAGTGHVRVRNRHSGKLLGVLAGSKATGAQVVQWAATGAADQTWRLVPIGARRIQNLASGLVLGIRDMATGDGAPAVQWGDSGTPDHLWQVVDAGSGQLKLVNANSAKVLGVDAMSAADDARVVQWADTGTADHLWRLRYPAGGGGYVRIQNVHSGKVLGVRQADRAPGAQVVQYADNGAADHLWRFI